MNNNIFRFIDLFAGIGGMRIPFEKIGGHCVFTSERDSFCKETYEANFPSNGSHVFAGKIEPYSKYPTRVPKHDILLAGFPCQPFSLAGVKKRTTLGILNGLACSEQGNAFYDIVKIINYHQPVAFLLENVKNLCLHDSGRTWTIIMNVLRELSYNIHTKVIDSSPWVPQKRKRVFIVGFSGMTDFVFDDLQIPIGPSPTLKDILSPIVDSKYTLSKKMWDMYRRRKDEGVWSGYSLDGPDDIARTITTRCRGELLIKDFPRRPRYPTPRECSRLMGFPSQWKIPVSDTQAYRQFGNAVVVPVVSAIAQLMCPHIKKLLVQNSVLGGCNAH